MISPTRLLAFAAIGLPLRLLAHDYWLQPDRFSGATGDPVMLQLLVGENLKVEEEREFQHDRTVQCLLVTAAGRQDLRDKLTEGAKPFARITLGVPGAQLFVLERTPASITLEGDKFTDYLKEEGLDEIIAERARSGESSRPARERYARFLKCYLRVGDKPEVAIPVVTLRLDITPELPTERALQAGDELAMRVSFDGVPLKQVGLFAAGRAPDGTVITLRLITDEAGRATVKLPSAGLWVLRLVHMRRAPVGDPAADWESFWAACTVGVR